MEPEKGGGGWYRALAEITALGLTFPLAIAIGYGGGWWLDRELETHPWLTILLTVCGVAAAFVQLIRFAARKERPPR